MEQRKITVCVQEPDIDVKTKLNTDFRIFEGIVYHLFANAVKYSADAQKINVRIEFKAFNLRDTHLSGTLKVII